MTGLVLRLDGLPFRATSDEVEEFFSESSVKPTKVHLLVNREQRPSGVGYIEVESDGDAKLALQMDGKSMGDSRRYIRIVRTDNDELQWQLRRQELYHENDTTAKFYCVRMYGIPYKISEYDIAKWVLPAAECIDVQIHHNHEGRPSGDATAYFVSEDVAKKALARDGEDMNGRYINLAMDDVSVSFRNAAGSSLAIRLAGLPFRATEQEIKDFFKPEAECTSVRVILNRDGRPSGEAIAEFATEEMIETAMKKDREHLGNRFVVLTREKDVATTREAKWNDSQQTSRGTRNGSGSGPAARRFLVKMGGIPYRATIDEIVDWFLPEAECISAKILKNRDNRPSGEAIAEFASEDDVKNALAKNKQYMGDRFVVLTAQGF